MQNWLGDIFAVDGVITEVGKSIDKRADEVYGAADMEVFPGGVDGHVHMDVKCFNGTPSDGYEAETVAAAIGGTTTEIDHAVREKKKYSK